MPMPCFCRCFCNSSRPDTRITYWLKMCRSVTTLRKTYRQSGFPEKVIVALGITLTSRGPIVQVRKLRRNDRRLNRIQSEIATDDFCGNTSGLDAIQAAIVSAKLPHLDDWTAAGQHNAKRYDHLFGRSRLPVGLPRVVTDRHIFNQYVIRVSGRDEFAGAPAEARHRHRVLLPGLPMHLQECFAYLGHTAGAFPESERAAKETLALPIHPELTTEQALYVVDTIRDS